MLVLASNSLRRQQLLSMLDIPYLVHVSSIDESAFHVENPRQLPLLLSQKKAEDVAPHYTNLPILGADTIVLLNGQVLEKPIDEADCYRILRLLSNQKHEVITAVTLLYQQKKVTFEVSSYVTFYPLSDADIAAYIATKEPFDKAGAYAIQGHGAKLIAHLEGDYYAVMGLPISRVYWQLKDWNIIE